MSTQYNNNWEEGAHQNPDQPQNNQGNPYPQHNEGGNPYQQVPHQKENDDFSDGLEEQEFMDSIRRGFIRKVYAILTSCLMFTVVMCILPTVNTGVAKFLEDNIWILIVFAILLCIEISQYPLTDHWLTAKVLGLVAYIGFGMIAIKRGKTWAFVAALVSFAYIFGAAKAHSALSFFTHFS